MVEVNNCFAQECGKSVVGEAFSQDEENNIYCSEDFIRKNAAVCCSCGELIVPKPKETTTERLRALGKDFHPGCFKCKDCEMVLNSGDENARCYPIDGQPFCGKCNANRRS